MIPTTELIKQVPPPLPKAMTGKRVSPELVPGYREFCDWLERWRHCAEPACQRNCACVGDPVQCFDRFYGGSGETARAWVRAGMFALMDGCTRREATREADAQLLALLKAMMGLPRRRAQRRRTVPK